MKIEFTETKQVRIGTRTKTEWKSHIANSFSECADDIERELWTMHESIPDKCWKLGCVIATRIED